MYQQTATVMTDYDANFCHGGYLYTGQYMGAYQNRRSNSRSGYRLFARVVQKGPTGSSRMPPRECVYEFFSQFGSVLDCYLPESATNVAYLCFEDEQTMESVLNVPEHLLCIDGVHVTLSRASPRPDYSMNETDRVFVKNVPENTTRTALRNYFSQFGVVTDVYIPKDKVTGEQKKFAFVTFSDIDSARNALNLVEAHRLVHIDRVSNLLTTALLQVMPAEPRPMSASAQMSSQNELSWKAYQYDPAMPPAGLELSEDAFTTASSTVANTPTSSSLSAEAAASVLISALSQLAAVEPSPPSGSPYSDSSSSELDEIIAKLSSFSFAEAPSASPTPGLATPGLDCSSGLISRASPAISDPSDTSVLTQLIEETLSRQSSSLSGNIFEQFLNPHWESRE